MMSATGPLAEVKALRCDVRFTPESDLEPSYWFVRQYIRLDRHKTHLRQHHRLVRGGVDVRVEAEVSAHLVERQRTELNARFERRVFLGRVRFVLVEPVQLEQIPGR